jgi:WD40 repeat protein
VWDTTQWKIQQNCDGHRNVLLTVAFAPDGKTLASGSADTNAKLWDTRVWVENHNLSLHLDRVRSLGYTPDSKILVVGAGDTVQPYFVQTGTPLSRVQGHIGILNALAVSPDGRTLAIGGTSKTVEIWPVPEN